MHEVLVSSEFSKELEGRTHRPILRILEVVVGSLFITSEASNEMDQ